MMKTTRHSLMAKGILVLLSLLILIFVFTYSWFVDPNRPVSASGLSLTTSAAADFDIRFGFSTDETMGDYVLSKWYTGSETIDFTSIETTDGNHYNLLATFKPVDLTGDGVTIIRPAMLAKNAGINVNKNTFEIAEPNKQYITFDLYVRSETEGVDVKLGSNSVVYGVVEGAGANRNLLDSPNVAEESSYGHFSEDSVVGAVRVSFVPYTGLKASNFFEDYKSLSNNIALAAAPSVLWIPRPDIFLKDTGTIGSWDLYKQGDSEWNSATVQDLLGQTQTYKSVSEKHYYYAIFVPDSPGVYTGGSGKYRVYSDPVDPGDPANPVVSDLSTKPTILTTSYTPSSETSYYEGRCRVNIWIDGCDAEARRAIDGGQFRISFEFTTG